MGSSSIQFPAVFNEICIVVDDHASKNMRETLLIPKISILKNKIYKIGYCVDSSDLWLIYIHTTLNSCNIAYARYVSSEVTNSTKLTVYYR